MTDPDQLPPELADLFAAERGARTTDASGRSAIRSRLAAVLVGIPLGAAAATAGALGGATKVLSIVALTVAAGGGAIAVVHHASTSRASPPRSSSVLPATPPREARPPSVIDRRASAPAPEAVPAPVPAPTRPARSTRHTIVTSSEPELLREAWTAVSSDDAPRALQLTERIAQLYPAGVLDEEREAVHVVALAKLHRLDEARVAASQFAERHPTSVHRALLERELHEQESP